MTDPKYTNLFGIAKDQPDVYETEDLPDDEQSKIKDNDDIGTSDSIERLHISTTGAYSKFQGKTLIDRSVDFSDRLHKKIQTGYDARSGNWELVGSGEKETPMQKYRRLQCEVNELQEEVSMTKSVAKDEAVKECITYPIVAAQLAQIQKQLSEMQLEETLGTDHVSNLSDPQGAQFGTLMAKLDTLSVRSNVDGEQSSAEESESTDSLVQYQMTVKPAHIQLEKSTRLTELEQRIAKMESLVGSNSDNKLSRLGCGHRTLLGIAHWLASRMALLDPSQLDAAEARASALCLKLDAVAEKKMTLPGFIDPEKEQKISELYEIAKKVEKLSQIVPQVVDRLISLQDLHEQGGTFAKKLSELETTQENIKVGMDNNRQILQILEDSLKTNLDIVKANFDSLESRVDELHQK